MLKDEIKKWFESDRSYEAGRTLFFKYSSNLAFKSVLNRQGNTSSNYARLCYELAKLAGIPEPLYKRILLTPVIKQSANVPEAVKVDINTLAAEDILKDVELYNLDELKYPNLLQVYKSSNLKGARSKVDIKNALTELKSNKLVQAVPEEVKRAFRLRQEFPFLYTKECPDTLKILVADMITAHELYVQSHAGLIESMDENTIAALSKSVVENYLENRLIWEELNHYKVKGTILGKHPIFDWIKRKEEIGKMAVPDLVKLKDQLENNIPRTVKKITDEPEHTKTAERQQRVEHFRKELAEVKRLLSIND